MKTDKKLIIDIILGFTLFYTFINIFAAATTTVQIYSYNVSESSMQISSQYLEYIKPLVLIATLLICVSFLFCILSIFITEKKLFRMLAIIGQGIASIVLLIFAFIAKLKIPIVNISNYPHRISYINYEYSNSLQAMFITLFALSLLLFAISLYKAFLWQKLKKAENCA